MSKSRKLKRYSLIGLLSVFFLIMAFIATTGVVKADDVEDQSLYARMNYIMQYVNEATAPSSNGKPKGVSIAAESNPGNAGAFIGYCDEAEEGIVGWISSRLSMSSMSYTYDQFQDFPVGGDSNKKINSVYYYARYGYTLGELGLDYTSTQTSFTFGRFVGGSLLMLAYIMALGVPAMFSMIFTVLKWINPFRLFVNGSSYNLMSAQQYATATDVIDSGTGMWQGFDNIKSAPKFLSSLASVVQDWYNTFAQFSWYIIIPIFVVSLVISIGFLHQSTAWSKGKKLVFRIVFLAIGVPLCGSLYTFTLDKCEKMTSVGNSAATKVISSVLVDFESWAVNMRLCPTTGMVIESESSNDTSAGQPTSAALSNLRKTCQEINAQSGSIPGLPTVSLKDIDFDALYDGSDLDVDNSSLSSGDKTELTNWNNTIMDAQKGNGDNLGSMKTVVATLSLISRYVSNDALEPGAYESIIKAECSKVANESDENNKVILSMFEDIGSSDLDGLENGVEKFSSIKQYSGYNIYGNGKIVAAESANKNADTGMKSIRYLPDEGKTPVIMKGKEHLTKKQGLSVMAMYNYLCSSFNSSNIVTYSPSDSSSGFVKESHRSVNLIGSGLNQFLYLINALTMLMALTVIGYYYAIGIVLANLFRGVRTIMSIPMALLGSLSAIAKFITYTVMMIVEIIGTIFLYSLVSELLFSLTDIIEVPFVNAIAKIEVFKSVANAILTISIIISTILYVVFTIKAMRMRKSFVKAVDEVMERIISKFVGAAAMPEGGKSGTLGKVGGAVATGAGMALGNKAMNAALNRDGSGATKGQKTSSGEDNASGSNSLAETGPSDVSNPQDGINVDDNDVSDSNMDVNADGPEINGNDPNAISDNSEGKALLEQKDLSHSDGSNKDTDAQSDAAIKGATGEVSAVQEDEIKQQEKEDAANQRKEAAKDAVDGAKDTAKGAAEVAAAAETGDAQMAADGAKDLKSGSDKTKGAADKAAHADEDAKAKSSEKMNQKAAENQQSDGVSNTSNGNTSNEKQRTASDVSDNDKNRDSSGSEKPAMSGGKSEVTGGSGQKKTLASRQQGPSNSGARQGSSNVKAGNRTFANGSSQKSVRSGSVQSNSSNGPHIQNGLSGETHTQTSSNVGSKSKVLTSTMSKNDIELAGIQAVGNMSTKEEENRRGYENNSDDFI